MKFKILTLTAFVLLALKSSSQQKDSSLPVKLKQINNVASDSGKITLSVAVDSSGKLITVTYIADSSTTSNEKMIEIATKRAKQIKYPIMHVPYIQKITFHFISRQ